MKESKKRVITAIVMVAVFAPLIFLGGYFYYGLCIALAGVACYELSSMHNKKLDKPKFISFVVGALGAISSAIFIPCNINYTINILLLLVLGLSIILFIICLFVSSLNITDAFFYIGCILYGGLPFGLMACVRMLFGTGISAVGIIVYMYMLCCSMLTDLFAYEVGIRIGKHKLAPVLSPKKSWEGAIGGTIIAGILCSGLLIAGELIFDFNLLGISNLAINIIVIVLLSFTLSIVSQIGDLLASKLKREYDIKDFGFIFPGHGGVMDRFDSAILTTIVFVIILIIFIL